MLTTLVLSRSYAGNLMSQLAVRYIPQPFQSLRDVLNHPSVTMIWEANTAYVQYIYAVQSGPYREVADLERVGRVEFQRATEFPVSVDTSVRNGGHVLMVEDLTAKVFMAHDFTATG
ncbi:hypothetical protein Pmani_003439 [Petrolisthes manimaculis]|uniref:Uncharacterized protein n=1 Tax=Petrolisthes manimaculis TaxID=1843537 RepID=A0AAE1UMH7_9EUCA|nr:hypothetical protein Pmani_003439 [Petrolisthes manimaculis]